MRVIQVGAYPPPYGGVTVHLMRLHGHLRRQGIDSTIVDLTEPHVEAPGVLGLDWPEAGRWLERTEPSIVHFHNFEPGNAAAYERATRRHVVVLSLHNERFGDEIDALGPLRRRRALARLGKLHCVVVDSARCERIAERLWRDPTEIRVIPEFIPPGDVPPLDEPSLLELRSRCRFLVASNAWKLAFHDGQDLYGLDLLIEMLRGLVHDRGIDVGMAFLLPGGGDGEYYRQMQERLRSLDLERRFVFVTEPLEESSSLWQQSDVVVRATNTDGSSLTVLEALSVGVPVVASDCVERPAGSVLFRNRDAAELTARVAEVLSDLPASRLRVRGIRVRENASSFVTLYDRLSRRWCAHEA